MANKVWFRYAFGRSCNKNKCSYTNGVITRGYCKNTQYRSKRNPPAEEPITALTPEMTEMEFLYYHIYEGDEEESQDISAATQDPSLEDRPHTQKIGVP